MSKTGLTTDELEAKLDEYMNRSLRLQSLIENLIGLSVSQPLGADLDLYETAIKKFQTRKETNIRMGYVVNVNDHIQIKGVDINDPNCEGQVIEVVDDGVYIANMNMPYLGTYSRHFVAFDDIL